MERRLPRLVTDPAPPAHGATSGHNSEAAAAGDGDLPVQTPSALQSALLEAIWRGDELKAALERTNAELALHREQLARAEETIAELGEIGEAAQAAIDTLRARLGETEKARRSFAIRRKPWRRSCFAMPAAPEASAWLRSHRFDG